MFLFSSSLEMEIFLLGHIVFDADSFYFTQEEPPAHLKACQPFPHGTLSSKKRHCLLWEHHDAAATIAISYVLKSNAEGSHMLLFRHPIIQGCYLSINALRYRAKPKLIEICWDYLLVSHISNSSSQGKLKGNWGCSKEHTKSKERGCCRYLKSWGIKMEERKQK